MGKASKASTKRCASFRRKISLGMKTSAYEKKHVPISEMLRKTALASDFMRRHGDPAATKIPGRPRNTPKTVPGSEPVCRVLGCKVLELRVLGS